MDIRQIISGKKSFIDLLLLADEQESMIDRYLERGEMFVLEDQGKLVALCVVTDEGNQTYEIKNLAVGEEYQRRGNGSHLVEFICRHYRGKGKTLLVGTGEDSKTISFYEHCGFVLSHKIPNFFVDHYDHPIFESGRQLIDMIYLRKLLS